MTRNTVFGEKPYYSDYRGVVLSTEDARQGETSGRMRRVLGYSLMLALIAGTAIFTMRWIG